MAATVTSLDDYKVKNEVRENAVAEIENGYTRIAHELLEAVMLAGLTQHQLLVFLAIARKTYGYQKKSDWISNEQLSHLTGILPHKCSAAKSALIKRKILTTSCRSVGINKNLDEWLNISSPKEKTLPKSGKKIKHYPNQVNLPESGKKSLPELGNRLYPNQVNTKDNITKDSKYNNTPLTPHEGNDEKLISNNRKTKIPYQEILQVYNETVGDRLPNAELLNDKRKQAIGKFWKELKNPSVDAARNYFEVFVETANPWYFGENDRGWRASFDYLLRPDTVTKTREGAL
ncbi:replication protein [Arsenophonus apicola]|uniref:Replication protein n=1 Tax=Arsenophonus apicola TaxID=2879119 RepID=A0ABY8P6E7_9GAMM|nr:replication protein [Arsenophonus apicola]WGO83164.1 replication protein [Arsenophonus apicola]WGO84506.1 replication protein [Arsenophonus apicola]